MSLACLVCHGMDSPSRSFRSYSVSSSDDDGRCAAIASCLAWKVTVASGASNNTATSKVSPFPGTPPRLLRSCAVTRDLVRDWNFDEFLLEG